MGRKKKSFFFFQQTESGSLDDSSTSLSGVFYISCNANHKLYFTIKFVYQVALGGYDLSVSLICSHK